MAQSTKPQLPIGYWLKLVDALLTAAIDQAQAEHGLTRTEWQTLNWIAESGGAREEHLAESLAAFADPQQIAAILAQFVARGWIAASSAVSGEPALYDLTGEGKQQHSVILATQKNVRQRAMQGIGEADYATVIRVLQQIAANLDGDIAQQ